jgi:hypothetical protein
MMATIGWILPRDSELHEDQATLLNVLQHIVRRAWVAQLYLQIRLDFIQFCIWTEDYSPVWYALPLVVSLM